MQITMELLNREVEGMTSQMETAKASMHQTIGALAVFKQFQIYLALPEPEPTPPISDTNQAVQDAVAAEQKPAEVVEPVVVAEEIQPANVPPPLPAEEIGEIPLPNGKRLRVNAQGKYEEVK